MLFFDSMSHLGKPQPVMPGFQPIRVTGDVLNADGTPHLESLKALAAGTSLIALDVESLPLGYGTSAAVFNESCRKLGAAVDAVRAFNAGARVGYYALMPWRDYWSAVSGDPAAVGKWHDLNGKFRYASDPATGKFAAAGLADKVDVVFPSVYTFYDDQAGWEKYARANLAEARRYQKQVYAFLMPSYHDSNKTLAGQPIPGDYWTRQLNVCAELADGVVIWGGWQQQWDQNAAWWQATVKFLGK